MGQAELLIIDEAAAIPLPLVKSLFGPYLMFLASTINGYEGTGRSLSLKLLQQLRSQNTTGNTHADLNESKVVSRVSGRVLSEVYDSYLLSCCYASNIALYIQER